jgi:hypothetical protein
MQLRSFLEAVGLDEIRALSAGPWPDDPVARLKAKAERLQSRLGKHHAMLVRERRAIEALRWSLPHAKGNTDADHRLQFHEERYQARLAKLRTLKQVLLRMQQAICEQSVSGQA